VRGQIGSAICAYLMVAIAKKRLNLEKSLNEILQIVSVNTFEQIPLGELLMTKERTLGAEIAQSRSQKLLSFND